MNAYHKNLGIGLLVSALLISIAWVPSIVVAKKPPKPPPGGPPPPVEYVEEVLFTPVPDAYAVAFDVNDSGVIVGRYRPAPDTFELRAIVWYPENPVYPFYGVAEDLTDRLISAGLLEEGIRLWDARCINNEGLIAAPAEGPEEQLGVFACNPDKSKLYRWMPEGATSVSAWDVSETGMIVGDYGDPDTATRRLFLWVPADPVEEILVVVDLQDESGDPITPSGRYGINSMGTYVVGTAEGKGTTPIFGFPVPSFEPGTFHDGLPIPAETLAENSNAFLGRIDVNDVGVVAGSISSPGSWPRRPARLLGEDWEVLTNSRKQSGESSAINFAGDICGIEWGGKQGFVFLDGFDPSFWELDKLLGDESPEPAPWLREPFGMSNSEFGGFPIIVGDRWETADQGPQRAVVLVPKP